MKKAFVQSLALLLSAALLFSAGFALSEAAYDAGNQNSGLQPESSGGDAAIKPYIQDDEDLLNDTSEAELYQEMLPLCQYGKPMFWSTDAKSSPEASAEWEFYRQHLGPGESGILLVINRNTRSSSQLTICAEGEMYQRISQPKWQSLLSRASSVMKSSGAYTCAANVFQNTLNLFVYGSMQKPLYLLNRIVLAALLVLAGFFWYLRTAHMTNVQEGDKHPDVFSPAPVSKNGITVVTSGEKRILIRQNKTDVTMETD